MATQTVHNVHLKITIDAVDYSCQFITATLALPGYSEGTTVEVACPDGSVVEPGERVNGTLSGEAYTDSTDGGLFWALGQASMTNAQVAYEIVWFADQANTVAFQIDGTATVPQVEIGWEKPGLSKHPVELTLNTDNGLVRPSA